MTSDRIRKWARAGESEQMGFKASTGQRCEAARTLCAMLNGHCGQVVIGVEDGGNVVGQQIGQDTLGDLQREFGTIEPPVFPSLSTIEVGRGRSVVVASVPSGHS